MYVNRINQVYAISDTIRQIILQLIEQIDKNGHIVSVVVNLDYMRYTELYNVCIRQKSK